MDAEQRQQSPISTFRLIKIGTNIVIIIIAVIVNLAVGTALHNIGVRNYFVTLTTLMIAAFFGVPLGIFVGTISALFGVPFVSKSINIIPELAVHLLITACVGTGARKLIFQSVFTCTVLGFGLGIFSALVNAVVTVQISELHYNTWIVTGLLFAERHCLVLATFLPNLAIDPLGKVAECLTVYWMAQLVARTAIGVRKCAKGSFSYIGL